MASNGKSTKPKFSPSQIEDLSELSSLKEVFNNPDIAATAAAAAPAAATVDPSASDAATTVAVKSSENLCTKCMFENSIQNSWFTSSDLSIIPNAPTPLPMECESSCANYRL